MKKPFIKGRARNGFGVPPPCSNDEPEEEPHEPHTLATLAAALVTCKHPSGCRVSARLLFSGRPVRIAWCAACGAMCSYDDPDEYWQSSAIAMLFSKGQFSEIAELIHGLRDVQDAIAEARGRLVEEGSPIDLALREIGSSLLELNNKTLVREVERIDHAIARMSASPHPEPEPLER
jgi:hypothetical protein